MSFRPIFGKPRLIQDWGEEQHERETHWTSLFYDLLIVAGLNAIAEPFEEINEEEALGLRRLEGSEEGSGGGGSPTLSPIKEFCLNAVLQFLAIVIPWNFLSEITCRFEDESFVGHLAFFVHCFGLASTTAGCVGNFKDNYKTLAVGIILTKIGLLILYARPIYYIPRAWAQCVSRCMCYLVSIGLMLFGLFAFDGPNQFEQFRIVLIVSHLWDLCTVMFSMFLGSHRLPIHIQTIQDRTKEFTMVIFGEAIFAITLRPRSTVHSTSHFYAALAITLWLIYSLALQENHIFPAVDDHALRRSFLFGFLWYYTQYLKQIFLLAASIGIKRAHLLAFIAPNEPIDIGTYHLLVWGMSLTLFSVVLLRSYSMGFGRHPNAHDPPALWRLKAAWWITLVLTCFFPQLMGITVMQEYNRPLECLGFLAIMMFGIILSEAYASNKVADLVKEYLKNKGVTNVDELTYLGRATQESYAYHSIREGFLEVDCPKAEKEEQPTITNMEQEQQL